MPTLTLRLHRQTQIHMCRVGRCQHNGSIHRVRSLVCQSTLGNQHVDICTHAALGSGWRQPLPLLHIPTLSNTQMHLCVGVSWTASALGKRVVCVMMHWGSSTSGSPSAYNYSDILTKPLTEVMFQRMIEMCLGSKDCQIVERGHQVEGFMCTGYDSYLVYIF